MLEMGGKKLPESLVKDVRFAFLDRDKSTVTAPKPSFRGAGEPVVDTPATKWLLGVFEPDPGPGGSRAIASER